MPARVRGRAATGVVALAAMGLITVSCGLPPLFSPSPRPPKKGKPVSAWAVVFTSRDDGFVLGGVAQSKGSSSPVLAVTHDGGASWSFTNLLGIQPTDLVPDRAHHIWMVAMGEHEGLLIEFSESGVPHPVTRLRFPLGEVPPTLSWEGASVGILATGNFRYLTTDDGRTWHGTPTMDITGFGAEVYATPLRGWALSPAGAWLTDDGGPSWTLAHPMQGLGANVQSVWQGTIATSGTRSAWFFFNAGKGANGSTVYPVLATTDGGTSFATLPSASNAHPKTVPQPFASVILNVPGSSAIAASSNGLWTTSIGSHAWHRLSDVQFLDDGATTLSEVPGTQDLWGILTSNGVLFYLAKSTDSGTSWIKVPLLEPN